MIEDLMKLKKQIDTMIETYKDLHPDDLGIGSTVGIASITDEEYNEYSQTHTAYRDDDARVHKINEDYEKEIALKRVREGYYENKFSKSQREKTTRASKGQSSLCVYGDS